MKLKTDRGGEYSSHAFLNYLQEMGIQTERGPANRPMANSVSKRFNLTLIMKIRTQLIQSGLPLSLWGEVAQYSSLQINCVPSKALNGRIPITVFTSLIPSHHHPFDHTRLKPFGCLAFAHDRHCDAKFAPLAKRFVMFGIEPNAKAWRLWDKSNHRIFVTGDVVFRETVFPAANHPESPPMTTSFQCPYIFDATHTSDSLSQDTIHEPTPSPEHLENSPPDPASLDNLTDAPNTSTHEPDSDITVSRTPITPPVLEPVGPLRTTRTAAPIQRYGFATTTSHDSDHPTYSQAMGSADKAAWLTAMQEEFDSLNQHSVGTLVDPPPDANVSGGMWVFSKKRDEFNHVVRFKARWVVCGNHQIKGVDFTDTHASVGMTDSLRLLFAIAATLKMKVCQFDVVTAFLNGDMVDVVYSRQVLGFIHPTHPRKVWLLNKSLYGTRQAACRWQQHFSKTAGKFNLQLAASDSAVYIRQSSLGLLILHLHVDDSVVFASSDKVMQEFKDFIHSQYDLKWTDQPSLYLGIRINLAPDGTFISLNQSHYIESTLERFAMTNCNTVKSPLPQKTSLTPGNEAEVAAAIDLPYQSLIGSLDWIASTTRPDIAYAVSQLGRFNSAWTLNHWIAAKHVLRYLKGSQDLSIRYTGASVVPLAYSDSDFSQCPTTRCSVSGFIICVGGGAVSWRSERQSVVALSTNEAKYIAASECAKHLMWVKSFLFDIMQQVTGPIPFHIDNKSAIDTATGPGLNRRSKHINRRHHFIRDLCQSGVLNITHVPTEEMLADFLTKPLGPSGVQHAIDINLLHKCA